MKLSEIHIRDPFILPFRKKYYLFGTPCRELVSESGIGFWCYTSENMEDWSEPIKCFTPPKDFWADKDYWAPEVHYYKGRFYMFATFMEKDHMRAVQVLASDNPEGPYEVWSHPLTPDDWMCLDGTLYVENEVPYMIFCHEWVQVKDGEMCIVQLSDDLKEAVGKPKLLFKASEPNWSRKNHSSDLITDGPFIHKCNDGKLLMLWSSYDDNGYVEAVAYSENGKLNGNWKHCEKTLSAQDGGHGMIFEDFDGKYFFTMHYPNSEWAERPLIKEIKEIPDDPYLEIV